jgi:hypothetical protein
MFSGSKETPISCSILQQALEDDDASIYFADGATNIGVVGGPVSGLQKVLARVSN